MRDDDEPAAPPLPELDEHGRARVRALLLGEQAVEVEAAADDRAVALDVRLLACGARLALDGWAAHAWTPALLDRIASKPSPAWRSVLLAADAGVDGAAGALIHAMCEEDRRVAAALGPPALTAAAAAGLADDVPVPAGIAPALGALIGAAATLRRALGRVPRPWEADHGEQPRLTDELRAMARALGPLLDAAGLALPDEPEVADVLEGTAGDDDADWVVYTLDEIAAAVATHLAPALRGALPPAVRDAWAAEWADVARALLTATATTAN